MPVSECPALDSIRGCRPRQRPKELTAWPTTIMTPSPSTSQNKTNKIQIDKDYFKAPAPLMTGRELLELAGKKPAENFAIYRKIKGSQPERIGLDEKIDLSLPGVERFLTLPLDQTEGFGARRDFSLPEDDLCWLANATHDFELVAEAGVLRVVLYGFPVPPGYNHRAVDVNVRIESGYPDTQIDMVYVHPELQSPGRRLNHRPRAPIHSMANCGSDGADIARPPTPGGRVSTTLATHFVLVGHWFPA